RGTAKLVGKSSAAQGRLQIANCKLQIANWVQSERSAQLARSTGRMLHVALWEPEIPPNTGNVARLCAATGATLHLIGRLGFRLDDRHLRRAGLDYWHAVTLRRHASLEEFETTLGQLDATSYSGRLFCFSRHAATPYTEAVYQDGDCL